MDEFTPQAAIGFFVLTICYVAFLSAVFWAAGKAYAWADRQERKP